MEQQYIPNPNRYDKMVYNRCGKSGLKLPAISLGMWINFGFEKNLENARNIAKKAFDLGVTHFDLANNYGPPYGSAEENFGKILEKDLIEYRDELIISSKAGYDMWPGPYGDFGSRKYLIASCNQSLKRMGLEYVDIFYHHRPDYTTPLEETMGALNSLVQQGKALYVGISNYPAELAKKAIDILNDLGTPCLIHQPKYNMLDRWVEGGLLDVLGQEGVGCIPFSPLEKGILTNKYFNGIPQNSRAANDNFLKPDDLTDHLLEKTKALDVIAQGRGQSLAQMALAWLLKDDRITSVLIGASSPAQVENSVACLDNKSFTDEELENIEQILARL